MCGICGEIRFDNEPASLERIGRMLPHLERRGPHASGVYQRQRVALGHRRLKIIDLSEHAQQPMVDAHLGLSIVYNGAVYNYRELREELEGSGYLFFSEGDTEVILKAYHRWGERCVERLNGMFAFCVHERDSGRVFLARDRLGIKPLYYAETGASFLFASNLQSLLAAGGVDTAIDPVALHHYMTFHSVVPPPRTLLKGVRKVPQAHTVRLDPDGRQTMQCYWEPAFGPAGGEAERPEEEWRDEVLETLRRSVRRRLVADVPVGVLLSGGVDSSLVVGLLAEAGQSDLNTFSVGFDAVNGEAGDEFRYSDVIAERFKTRHHKHFISADRTLSSLRACVEAMSEPMVSHDVIGFYLLAEEVSKHITVVQSGQGADEVFAGYRWYPPLLDSRDPFQDYRRAFFDRSHEEFLEVVEPAWAGEDYGGAFVRRHFDAPGAEHPVDKALRLDGTVMLVDDPVKRVDNTTMAWGLEARVPFLDHEVVELGARIPPSLKVRDGGKYILKEAARKVIPAAVIDRPKGYFPVPALKYLRGPFLDLVQGILDEPAARERGLFRRGYVDRLFNEPEKHITPLQGSKLWQIALLEYWLQCRGI